MKRLRQFWHDLDDPGWVAVWVIRFWVWCAAIRMKEPPGQVTDGSNARPGATTTTGTDTGKTPASAAYVAKEKA